MPTFDVWFEDKIGVSHSIVDAAKLSDAAMFIESVKGGNVRKAEIHDLIAASNPSSSTRRMCLENFTTQTPNKEIDYVSCKFYKAAEVVRGWMVSHYGDGVNLAGQCNEASALLHSILHLLGYDHAGIVNGWVTYDDTRYASEPYEPHTWVSLRYDSRIIYLDVTADQFNYGMDPESKFPSIVCAAELPHGYSLTVPDVRDDPEL